MKSEVITENFYTDVFHHIYGYTATTPPSATNIGFTPLLPTQFPYFMSSLEQFRAHDVKGALKVTG